MKLTKQDLFPNYIYLPNVAHLYYEWMNPGIPVDQVTPTPFVSLLFKLIVYSKNAN